MIINIETLPASWDIFFPSKYFISLLTSALKFHFNHIFQWGADSYLRGTRMAIITHWGRVTYICISTLTIIGSDNGLAPGRRQAIIWTNAEILLIEPPGTSFSGILIEIHTISFKKMQLKMSSAKWRPFCLSLNVIIRWLRLVPEAGIKGMDKSSHPTVFCRVWLLIYAKYTSFWHKVF